MSRPTASVPEQSVEMGAVRSFALPGSFAIPKDFSKGGYSRETAQIRRSVVSTWMFYALGCGRPRADEILQRRRASRNWS